jgi:hypothetical protein
MNHVLEQMRMFFRPFVSMPLLSPESHFAHHHQRLPANVETARPASSRKAILQLDADASDPLSPVLDASSALPV